MRRLFFMVCLLLALVPTTLVSNSALAQGNPEAVKLFNEGRDAIQRGDYNLACAKFEQSNALDKRVGTLLNLALCEEKRTRLVRALSTWRAAAELAKRLKDEREKEASDRADALAPRVPKLTVNVPADAPEGVTVRLEGLTLAARTLEASQLGTAIPVDPGKVKVILIAPDGTQTPKEVTMAEGASETVTFDTVPVGAPSPVPDPGNGNVASGGIDGLMIAGIVVGVVGLAGLGVGFGFGGKALSKQKAYEAALCDGEPLICPTPEGQILTEQAEEAATISTIFVIVGGVVAAAGVTLIVISATSGSDGGGEADDATAAKLELGVTPTGVRARYTW